MSVQDKLEEFRKEQEGYIEPSFATISAYGANAAMCHYSATKESDTVLEDHGFYLVDKTGNSYTVLDMSPLLIFNLNRILHCFRIRSGIHLINQFILIL